MDQILSVIGDDALRRLYLYWDEKRAGRHFPARRDIDPVDIAFILGWVMLIDVTHNPLRFRFRLHGSEMGARLGRDLTGRYVDEHPRPELGRHMYKAWSEVVSKARPMHGFYDDTLDNRLVRFESLRLPLSSDGQTIDMLLVAVRDRTEIP
jgi:hypothetical protein